MARSIATGWLSDSRRVSEAVEAVAEWEAFQGIVSSVSRKDALFTTNLFLTSEQFEGWSAVAPIQTLARERAVLALRADRDFHRVYHVAENNDALTAALAELPPGIYVSDLIGQGDSLDRAVDAYVTAGYTSQTFLRRMSRIQSPGIVSTRGVISGAGVSADRALPEDVQAVAELLERLLDRFTEQLPGIDELDAAAAAGRLLIVRRGDGLAGMLMYELRGKLAHLRFWHVDHDTRGAGVGRCLMARFLDDCEQARRIVLWVIGTNQRSIDIYRHYGFAEDGLLDRIMILHKDQN